MTHPLRITGGFGTGKTTALLERTKELRASGRTVVMFGRPSDVVAYAADLLARFRLPHRVVDDREQLDLVRRLAPSIDWSDLRSDAADPMFALELAKTVLRYQSSFLGAEELFVHAEAAGELGRWEALARFTDRYLAELRAIGAVDRAGAIVDASMAMRDPSALAAERARFDDLVVDDYQLVDFATNRLLTQLAGRTGSLTVAGNGGAAIASEHGGSSTFLEAFCRRFECEGVDLGTESRRGAVTEHARVAPEGAHVLTRDRILDAVGREWPVVVIAGTWGTPRPRHRWFDPHLFSGPDVPSEAARDRAWQAEERRRFDVACSRATERTVIVSSPG